MATNSKFSYIFVAISFVSTALLYVYFKNKVSKVDEKLDMMYQLIQSHAMDNEMIMQRNMQMGNQDVSKEQINLIEVSENETLDSDDSSDEDNTDSDNESDQLVLGENMELGDVKKIELNLDVEENEEEDKDITLKKLSNHDNDINEQNEESLEEKSNSDQEDDQEDVQEQINNIELELKEEVVEEIEALDYNKLKVVELKSICRDRKLTNYAGLKKAELIELLTSS